jgi:hypothetical protein
MPADDARLRRLYPVRRTVELAAELGRSKDATYARARKLGLRKKQVFAADHRPPNYLAPGAIRVYGKKGYQFVKLRDGAWPDAWDLLHRVRWEAAHGPVPPGHVLAFKDGNPQHTDPANLELVARADWMRRYHPETTLPPLLAQLIRIRAALTRAINQRTKKEEP